MDQRELKLIKHLIRIYQKGIVNLPKGDFKREKYLEREGLDCGMCKVAQRCGYELYRDAPILWGEVFDLIGRNPHWETYIFWLPSHKPYQLAKDAMQFRLDFLINTIKCQ